MTTCQSLLLIIDISEDLQRYESCASDCGKENRLYPHLIQSKK